MGEEENTIIPSSSVFIFEHCDCGAMRRSADEEAGRLLQGGAAGLMRRRGCTCTLHCRRRNGHSVTKLCRRRRRRYHNCAAPMAEAKAGRGYEGDAQTVSKTILAFML